MNERRVDRNYKINGKGDISQAYYDEIIRLCIMCSQGRKHIGVGIKDPMSKGSKPHSGGIT